MLAKRIIPCLDIKDGKVVKGVNFVNLIDAGDPVECATAYDKQGADEIVFLDITATSGNRKTVVDMVKKTAANVFVPFTVGGGIRTIEDYREVLRAGADKVSINSQAVKTPNLITEASKIFGSQCVVVAVDVKKMSNGKYNVFISGGQIDTGIEVLSYIEKIEKLGAGEILLTSMDADGTKQGFDIEITKKVADLAKIPVIASGGCGKLEHFLEVFKETKASAALAASLFHFGELTVPQVKDYLTKNGILVRV